MRDDRLLPELATGDTHHFRKTGLARPQDLRHFWLVAGLIAAFCVPLTAARAARFYPLSVPRTEERPALTEPAFHVASDGSDEGDGSAERPFATLARAQLAMRASTTRRTFVHGGNYTLATPVALEAEDSGFAFSAIPGARVVLTGDGVNPGPLISMTGANHIQLTGLTFADTVNGPALALTGGQGNRIVGNAFRDTGIGILLTGSSGNKILDNTLDRSSQSAIEVKDGSNSNVFDGNRITGTDALAQQGGGFFLHGANGNRITHNLVQDTAGIGIGVVNWDDTTINVGTVIAHNIVRNTSTRSSDSGAIYLLGRSHVDMDCVIAGNDIDGTGASGDSHTIGIYLDDSSSGVLVQNNVVRGLGTHAVQVHGGDDNLIRNNIFDLGSTGTSAVLFQAAPADTNPTNTMLGNAVIGNIISIGHAAQTAYTFLDGGTPEIRGNLYFAPPFVIPADAAERDADSAFGDPAFVDASIGDYTIRQGSAAFGIGFTPLHPRRAGPRSIGLGRP